MNKRLLFLLFFIVFTFFFLPATAPITYKKKGYFKIDFPEKKYQLFDQPGYPYTFEYPVYSQVIKDTTFFDARPENDGGSILMCPVSAEEFTSATKK